MIDYFIKNGYKFLLTIGLLVGESPEIQCICAEKDCITVILECLKIKVLSPSLAKWAIWVSTVSMHCMAECLSS